MPPALGRRHEDEDYSPPPEGRRERIEGTPATCPPSNEGGLQGGHRKSSPSLDSTGATPLKSPLGQGGTSPRATNFRKDSRILSHLQGCRVGCGEPEDPPRSLMPSAPPWRGFSEEPSMPP